MEPGGLVRDDRDLAADGRPRRTIGPYVAIAVAIVAAMSMVAAIGFRSTLSGWSFVSAAAIGTAGASAAVLIARSRRLLLGESVALSAAAFIVLGGVAVGGVPTPGAYGDFVRGLVDGWADLLSAAPPADVTVELRALPFTVAWLAAAVGGEIARHTRRPGLPAIGPILALALSLLFTIEERWLALLQGAGILAGTLALITAAQRLARRTMAGTADDQFDAAAVSTNRRRLTFGAVVVVGAVIAAPLLGPRLPFAEARDRFDLRRYQVPPFDPLAVPSPLVQLKASLKDERRDDVVFTVEGDTEVDRWPLAVLTDYDGVVWTVADPDRHADAAEFVPVDTQLPELEDTLPKGARTVEHTVEIHDLGGFFLPTAGTPTRLSFADDPDPRMNLGTGTVALPGGLPDDFSYRVTSAVVPESSEADLEAAKITPDDRSEELELLPPPVRNLAADLVEGKDRGWAQMAAIRDKFVNEGFYDVTAETPPGHSYARISEMLGDPARIVGYEEQYAAAAAVMARVASLPARVVVGYRIPADRWHGGRADVTAGDISAWIELDAGELGWVPVDVSPDRSRTPDPETQGSTTEQIAVPNPPPPPPPPPEVAPPRQEDDEVENDEAFEPIPHEFERSGGLSIAAWVAIGAGGVPVLLLATFAMAVVAWKAWRRRRRRLHGTTSGRVAGAWAEAIDRCTESGVAKPTGTTPHEAVGIYAIRTELGALEPELRRLAAEVDRAAFAADPPGPIHVERAWEYSDRVSDELRRQRNAAQRMRMRLDPRPLLRDEAKAGSRS
jgi:transglutaminase-like putative cysteine protease